MNESIIVGLVVGVGVAAMGAFVGHHLRLKEMKEQWAEEERRRKSDHKRDLLETELGVIYEFVDAVVETWSNVSWWAHIERHFAPEARAELGKEAFLMHGKANTAALTLGDEALTAGVKRLIDLHRQCGRLLDVDTGMPRPGREQQHQNMVAEMRTTGADLRRRGRELLQEL